MTLVRKILMLIFVLTAILTPANADYNNTTDISAGEKTAEIDLNASLQFFADIIVFVFIILAFAIIGGKVK